MGNKGISLTLPLFFFVLSSTLFSQHYTGQIIVTSRSLAVEPATNNSVVPGGITTFLTTCDFTNTVPFHPFSGEVKPKSLGSADYITDYEGHLGILNPDGNLVNYGEMVISNLPVGVDTDGDGLPDFLEINQSSSFSVNAADREDYRYDNQPSNSQWTLSFTRAANAYQGTYTLRKATDPTNVDKIWNGKFQIKGSTGSVVFYTNSRTFTFNTLSFDTAYPETNTASGTYGITSDGRLLASGFWMTSSLGPSNKIYVNPFLIGRVGGSTTRGKAVLYASDGHPPATTNDTAYPDYTEFHLEITNFPTALTTNPTPPSAYPWSDGFSSNSSSNYLDFRYSHFARLEITNSRLNLITSDYPYGEDFGNLSLYTPPHLLLPLDASWDISLQVSLPSNDTNIVYRGVGLGLTPENTTYDVANLGATVYSVELAQDDDPATPGSFIATSARKDWEDDTTIGQLTNLAVNAAYLRFAYDANAKILTTYHDTNTAASVRTWRQLEQLSIDPADTNSVASSLGLTSQSKIRLGLWADAFVTNAVPASQIWIDNLSVQATPFPPAPLTNGIRGNLGQVFSYAPSWSNSPTSYSATNLPPGLSNNSSTGVISGTPTMAGYYRIVQTASNSAGTTLFTIPITIPGATQALPFGDIFTNSIANRYMPLLDLASPSQLVVTNGVLRFISTISDLDGSLAAWIPNVPLPLTSSWDVVVDANMPTGWNTPYAAVGLTLMPYEDNGTVESTAMQRRINLKLARDTEDPKLAGNYLGRAAYTNDIEYSLLPWITTTTPATRATLRYSFHAPTKTLSTWYRTNGANSWEELGTPFSLDPTVANSLGKAWGLSNASTLRVALWGDSNATNGSAGQLMELDNFYATGATGLIYPSLPTTLTRRSGQPLFISASPRDPGSYTFAWKKGSVTNPDLPFVPGFTNHLATYYLGNPSPSDSGNYYLLISKDGQSYGTNSTTLTITTNAPAGPRSDDFSGDLGRWNGVWGFDAHDAYLKVSSGRLQVISDKAGSENTQSFYFWDHLLPSDQSWEISVDAYLDASITPPLTETYFYHSLRLEASIPVNLTNLNDGTSGLEINFAEDEDGLGNRRRTIQNVLSITNDPGWAELTPNPLPLTQTSVSLRLRFESTNKTLTSYFRTNSSTAWQTAAVTNFSSLPISQFTNGFAIQIGSIAEPSFVITEGQAWFDNFSLKYDLSLSNAAVVTKNYDGTRTATITGTLAGVVSGDAVNHDGSGIFNTSEAGSNKPVTANLSLSGTHAQNYLIVQPTGLTGTIRSLSDVYFGNLNPTNQASDGLSYLLKYAYGAADPTNPISQTLRPVTTLTTSSGQPVLTLTYYMRTNDTNLNLQPVWSSTLTGAPASWSTNVTVASLGTTNTNGLVLERRQATIPIDNTSKKFLRLKATLK